jgi:hypothetical protein
MGGIGNPIGPPNSGRPRREGLRQPWSYSRRCRSRAVRKLLRPPHRCTGHDGRAGGCDSLHISDG